MAMLLNFQRQVFGVERRSWRWLPTFMGNAPRFQKRACSHRIRGSEKNSIIELGPYLLRPRRLLRQWGHRGALSCRESWMFRLSFLPRCLAPAAQTSGFTGVRQPGERPKVLKAAFLLRLMSRLSGRRCTPGERAALTRELQLPSESSILRSVSTLPEDSVSQRHRSAVGPCRLSALVELSELVRGDLPSTALFREKHSPPKLGDGLRESRWGSSALQLIAPFGVGRDGSKSVSTRPQSAVFFAAKRLIWEAGAPSLVVSGVLPLGWPPDWSRVLPCCFFLTESLVRPWKPP